MNSTLLNFSAKLSPKWSNEVVEPIDYEEFLSQYRSIIERDPLKSILDFPPNDIDFLVVPKTVRTLELNFPEEDKETLSLYIQECLKCYMSDYRLIRFQYRNFSLACSPKVPKIQFVNALLKQEYEIDFKIESSNLQVDQDNVSRLSFSSNLSSKTESSLTPRGSWANFDLRNSVGDVLINEVFEKFQLESVDQSNEAKRQENRQDSLFSLYGYGENQDNHEKRLLANPPLENQPHRILVKCLQLKFDIEMEPIFASMALYDAKERKKLSENFYFDLNTENVKRMLGAHIPYSDTSTISRSAIFEISNPNPDLFLVIRLEKVLQGDLQECLEPYLKEDKNLDKIKSNIVSVCDRLGKYRQPFAWTAVYLFNVINGMNSLEKDDKDCSLSISSSNSLDRKKNSEFNQRGSAERRSIEKRTDYSNEHFLEVFDNFRPITLTISSLFKQESEKLKDEDLYKFLSEFKRPSSIMKKMKCIPGTLKLDLSPCTNKEIRNCLTPELLKVNPYTTDEKCRPTKEVLEFSSHNTLLPHSFYRHLLYVSPKEVNFNARPGSARNITVKVQLMCGEQENQCLTNIFGKSSCPDFTNEMFSVISYHNKCPNFYDEIKMKLPTLLSDEHHLLFTFYHVSCQKKLDQVTIDTPIGYTWLPLLKNGLLVSGEFSLPVLLDPPPLNYSYIPPDVYLPNMRWLDNHKGVFNITIDAVSTIYPQDKHLMKFWTFYDSIKKGFVPNRIKEDQIDKEFRNVLIDLQMTKPSILIKFLPSLINSLINLLSEAPVIAGRMLNIGQSVFEALCLILQNLREFSRSENLSSDSYGRLSILTTFIHYQSVIPHPLRRHFENQQTNAACMASSDPNAEMESIFFRPSVPLDYECSDQKIVHRELALQWVVSSGACKELAMKYSWFFLELIVKSMCEHLMYTQSLQRARKGRFCEQFLDDVTMLVHNITSEVISRFASDHRLVSSLNACLAFFMFDLFSIMDRGFVLNLIRSYCKQMNAKITSLPDAATLIELKLDFIQIVCIHEHYLPLNLPFGTPFTLVSAPVSPSFSVSSSTSQNSFLSSLTNHERISSFAELSSEFKQQHYLVGLLLSDIFIVLNIQNSNLHTKVVNCLRNLLSWHDSDPRYVMPECKMRIAVLYLPLLAILMESLSLLYNWNIDSKDKYFDISDTQLMNETLTSSNMHLFNESFFNSTRKTTISSEVTRSLLISFLWVVKNIGKTIFMQWLADRSHVQIVQLLRILDISVACFEYVGKMQITRNCQQNFSKTSSDIKSKLEDVILGQGSARNELILRKKAQSTPINNDKPRWRKDYMIFRSGNEVLERPKEEVDSKIAIEGNLSTEVSLIVIDILENVVHGVTNSDPHQSLIGMILKVLIHLLSTNQSTAVLPHLFATQRSLVSKFHAVLFDEESEQCADLCLLLLKHCGSLIASTRSQAAASLYLLMKQTFEIGNNFARIKMQITMSLSSLVGTDASFSEDCLRRSLKTLLEYAENDESMQDCSFPEQVHDLVFNLHMILSDTVKMKEFQEDPEMLIDLMYRIAKGYQNSPDLRLTWLSNMAQKHMERNNYSEAGMCLVHSASLVSEYLAMLHNAAHLPVGAVTFESVSPNAIHESAVSDDVVNPDQDGLCLGSHFSEAGLCGLLEHAASCFQSAGLYEPMNDIYEILIPVALHNRDFKKLSNIHCKLHEAFSRIEQLHGKRVFGTYFRVGFYGSKFGDLDGEEFIYKEPTLTKLPEIFSRLENFYSERFGTENIVIIKDSNNVDKSCLNEDKAYIQITYVEPYFEAYELRYKKTHFEKNYNIKRFIYSTPFTISGRAHGDLHEQHKRKTILTTAMHFPYVKTRIKVIDRKQVTLTPIEVAIEDIQKKTQELFAATNQDPPDPKILQMVLQGCIGTTVNQGPLEIALVFLSSVPENRKMIKFQNKLRLCFKDFSKKCLDALKKNKNLINITQKEYQKELDRNYKKFTERLQPLIAIHEMHSQIGANGF